MREVEVAIIGAGSAGLAARREVAKVTDNYVVIEAGALGTTCARVGCMPSKVLIQAANDFERRKQMAEEGILGSEQLRIDTKQVMAHVRKLRDRFVRAVKNDMNDWVQTHLIQKRATFVDRNTLDLGDEKIRAKKIIIATGSRPILPKAWEPYKSHLINTDQFFEQEDLPGSVAIIGLGVIGLELGQALHRLGVRVTGVGLGKSMAGLTDPEVVEYSANKLSEEMDLHFDGVTKLDLVDGKLLVVSGEKQFLVDQAFLTMGRRPNVDGLGFDQLGIHLDERGYPQFDKTTGQIEDTNLFIAGDVNADRPILHEASDEGRIAGFNATRDQVLAFKRRLPMGITFSDPEIAVVGQSHRSLVDQGVSFEVGRVSFEGQGRAIVKLKEKGQLRVYAEKKTGRLLGAEMFAPEAEHLAHLLAWVMSMELTVFDVLAMPFYHPVIEEGLRTALRDVGSKVCCQDSPLEVKIANNLKERDWA